MRISRPCFDKYWRCPGWAGGGCRHAKVERCPGGSLTSVIDFDSRRWKWKFHQCPECGVWVMPYMVRYLSPTYVFVWVLKSKWGDWKYEREWRRRNR